MLVILGVFSAFLAQESGDQKRSKQALRASNSMMIDMVDAAPAGILVLDGAGRITFANESARDILDLTEDCGTGDIETPGWVIRDPAGVRSKDFSCLLSGDAMRTLRLAVEWANGWKVDLMVSVRPLQESSGRTGGMVATFERPSPRP